MKRIKKIILGTVISAAVIALATPGIIRLAEVIATEFAEDTENQFTYTDASGNKFNVYPLLNVTSPDGKIPCSISWGGSNPEDTPATLTIPNNFVKEVGGSTYVTYAISQSGFAYCDFTKVILPNNIKEIKPQAFLGCTALTSFSIPYGLTEIKSSTFMDCRALTTIEYLDENGAATRDNTNLTEIGDHAFTSCVSLVSTPFNYATSLTRIGQSAFQGCTKLARMLLPEGPALTIEEYAFANCASMTISFIPNTVTMIRDYAFANDTKLTLYLMAETVDEADAMYSTNYRKLYTTGAETTQYIPVQENTSSISIDDEHPNFLFTVINDQIDINGSNGKSISKLQDKMEYAAIIGYLGDSTSTDNFVITNKSKKRGQLTIPNYIKKEGETTSYPVCVIEKSAFLNHTEIAQVVFNENLVKIRTEAFNGCKYIDTLNFEACTNLKEISTRCFGNSNDYVTELKLPASLRVLDGYAFDKFNKVETVSFKTDSDIANNRDYNMIGIGRYAFRYCGQTATNKGTCTVELPCSLSDQALSTLKVSCGINGGESTETMLNMDNNYETYPVGSRAFAFAGFIKVLKMAECSCSNHQHSDNWISFGNAACALTTMRVFISSSNLYRMHINAFKLNYYLHSAVLNATRAFTSDTDWYGTNISQTATAEAKDYPRQVPWKNGIFGACPNAVVYVNLSQSLVHNKYAKHLWYQDSTYKFANAYNSGNSSADGGNVANSTFSYYEIEGKNYNASHILNARSYVPVYYGCDLSEVETMVLSNQEFHTLDMGTYSILTNYQGNSATVDCSSIASTCAANGKPITEIGNYAFAINQYQRSDCRQVINIPDGVTKIGEGAFFSRLTDTGALYSYTKVTVGNPSSLAGTSKTYTDNYCNLPSSLTSVGLKAFLNHSFKYIKLNNALEYMGINAFTALSIVNSSTTTSRSQVEQFDFVDNSYFTLENDNIYYKINNNKYVLLHNAQKEYADGTDITVKDKTIAIGPEAFVGLTATSVTIPSTLTTIYGFAFAGAKIQKVQGDLSGIKYINHKVLSGDSEVYNKNNGHYNAELSYTYGSSQPDNYNNYGAFKANRDLVEMDFTQLTSLRGIGRDAFNGCTNLSQCVGNDGSSSDLVYRYKLFNSVGNYTITEKTENILDIRKLINLEDIGGNSFESCKKLNYIHTMESQVVSGQTKNPKAKWGTYIFNGVSATALVGEKAATGYHKISSSHYVSNTFTSAQTVYYYAESKSDIVATDASSLNYWTYDPSDSTHQTFILMKGQTKAETYFDSL